LLHANSLNIENSGHGMSYVSTLPSSMTIASAIDAFL